MQQREKVMVKELCDIEDGLSPKELRFVEDMFKKPPGYALSEAQLQWLEALWDRELTKKCR